MNWFYVVWFIAGILFSLACFGLSVLYVYMHKEKYATAFVKHTMTSAMAKAKAHADS